MSCMSKKKLAEKEPQKNFFELETEFRKRGCDHMTTHTDFENELSQAFYSQIGMHKTTIELWKKL